MRLCTWILGILPVIGAAMSLDGLLDERGPGDQLVMVDVGNQKVMLGTAKGDVLYQQVYHALSQLCPAGKSTCAPIGRDEYNKHIATFFIDYYSKQDQSLIGQGSIWLWIEQSNFRTDPIRQLMINTTAAAVEAMVDRDSRTNLKNCAYYENKVTHSWTDASFMVCNIADYVAVGTTHVKDILTVHFELEDPAINYLFNYAPFDCVRSLTSINTNLVQYLPKYGKELGGNTVLDAFCPNKTVTPRTPNPQWDNCTGEV